MSTETAVTSLNTHMQDVVVLKTALKWTKEIFNKTIAIIVHSDGDASEFEFV